MNCCRAEASDAVDLLREVDHGRAEWPTSHTFALSLRYGENQDDSYGDSQDSSLAPAAERASSPVAPTHCCTLLRLIFEKVFTRWIYPCRFITASSAERKESSGWFATPRSWSVRGSFDEPAAMQYPNRDAA
jgi:hypothetical protein